MPSARLLALRSRRLMPRTGQIVVAQSVAPPAPTGQLLRTECHPPPGTLPYVVQGCAVYDVPNPDLGTPVKVTLANGSTVEVVGRQDRWSHIRYQLAGRGPEEGWIASVALLGTVRQAGTASPSEPTISDLQRGQPGFVRPGFIRHIGRAPRPAIGQARLLDLGAAKGLLEGMVLSNHGEIPAPPRGTIVEILEYRTSPPIAVAPGSSGTLVRLPGTSTTFWVDTRDIVSFGGAGGRAPMVDANSPIQLEIADQRHFIPHLGRAPSVAVAAIDTRPRSVVLQEVIAEATRQGRDPRIINALQAQLAVAQRDELLQAQLAAAAMTSTGQTDDFGPARVRLRGARIFAPYMIDPARSTHVRADVLNAGTLELPAYWPVQIIGEARIYAPFAQTAARTGVGPGGRGPDLIGFRPQGNGALVYRIRTRDPRVPTGLAAAGWIFANELDAPPAPSRSTSQPLQTAPAPIVVNRPARPRPQTFGEIAAAQAAKAAAFQRFTATGAMGWRRGYA